MFSLGFLKSTDFSRDEALCIDDKPHVKCGKPPHLTVFVADDFRPLSILPGAIKNLTGMSLPTNVEALLSYGVKFMLPPFSLFCPSDVLSVWDRISLLLSGEFLSFSCYLEQRELNAAFRMHCTDEFKVSRSDRRVLCALNELSYFLFKHSSELIVVEGDKGKLTGLVHPSVYASMCREYIDESIRKGLYKLVGVHDRTVLGSRVPISLAQSFRSVFNHRLHRLMNVEGKDTYGVKKGIHKQEGLLFHVSPDECTERERLSIKVLNKRVMYWLTHCGWQMPSFRPTLKFHKDPIKLRPVVSKRFSPSIGLGKAIKLALDQIMYVLTLCERFSYILSFCFPFPGITILVVSVP